MIRFPGTYKSAAPLTALMVAIAGNASGAEQRVITSDGREVLLRQNGTWEFISSDRFADTKDGRRVRLKQDGTWQYVGHAPLKSEQRVRTPSLDMELREVVIEKRVEKVQKNRRVSTRTVFYTDIEMSPVAEKPARIDDIDSTMISVQDSDGKPYSLLSIEPDPVILEPGSQSILVVRVAGSPLWWEKPDSMSITFSPPLFGLEEPITLSRDMDDIDEEQVDDF